VQVLQTDAGAEVVCGCVYQVQRQHQEVEKELGVSYPTVKNKLEDVANALGHKSEEAPVEETNRKEFSIIVRRRNIRR